MRIQRLRFVALPLLMALASTSVWAAPPRDSPAPSRESRACQDVALGRQPGWTLSGGWSNDGSTLLVVDAFYNKVLRFSNRGKFQGLALEPPAARAEDFLPSVLKGQGTDRYLELAQANMVRLDENLAPVKNYDLTPAAHREGEDGLKGIFQWEMARDEAVVFGDVWRSDGPESEQWASGFFRVPIESPRAFRSLHEISPRDPMRLFYRLGNPLIASIGETSYILLMEERPRIVRSRKGQSGLEPMNAFPPGLSKRPALPTWKNRDEYARVMRVVERSSMPVALLAWEGHLFVVGRHAEDGRTRWSLVKIDPQADRVVWTTDVPLPTAAHHVTVVPGSKQWAWIEKGVVRGLFNQDIDRVFFLDSAKLREIPGPGKNICQ